MILSWFYEMLSDILITHARIHTDRALYPLWSTRVIVYLFISDSAMVQNENGCWHSGAFFLFWSRHVYTPIVFSRWPYFHKRKIHTFLRKPFCLAYKFFSSFYFIAYIVDIGHYTHHSQIIVNVHRIGFFNIHSFIQSNFYFSQTK